jgi:uncharacterized membrane protein YcaP (DUF421 family)
MKKEDIHWDDWHRIFIGAAPAEFLIEVFIRTIIMYLALLIVLRLMGKRMGGMLTISELAVMITLGAIICVPMQIPDRGLVQGIVVLTFALFFQRGLNLIGWKNEKLERLIQGESTVLVKNGALVVDKLDEAKISRQQLYGALRSQGIHNLGEVERVYMEACGLFSVYKFEQAKAGLPILPPKDKTINGIRYESSQALMVCTNCGMTSNNPEEINGDCSNCHQHNWQQAMI